MSMSSVGRSSSHQSVRCPSCRSPVWTANRVWCLCDICGERIWLDLDHPEAPPDLPRHLIEEDPTGRPGWSA